MLKINRALIFLIFLLAGAALIFWLRGRQVEQAPGTPPEVTLTATAAPMRTAPAASATSLPDAPTPHDAPAPGVTGTPWVITCGPYPLSAQIAAQLTPESWLAWIERLSGAQPVTIDGTQARITTRWTPAMFGADGESPQPNARAFEYVLETARGWYPAGQIQVQSFNARSRSGETLAGKNLILSLPGQARPDEVVLLTAHLDSLSSDDPASSAPGAEDNASGAATLLEAARLFKDYTFARTIRIIWFTGEEQGLLGSRAYLDDLRQNDPAALDEIVGVVNLDMFGYDSNDDGCFELHVGTLPASNAVGQCFVASMRAAQPELTLFDYLTEGAIGASDHGSFWNYDIGAVEVLENMFDNQLAGGCPDGDPNAAYHTPEDTVEHINPTTGARIAVSALAAAADLAEPLPIQAAP